jgi:hypothetical protein
VPHNTSQNSNKRSFEDIIFPHYLKKPSNVSYYASSPVGRLYDIGRELLSDTPLPSFKVYKAYIFNHLNIHVYICINIRVCK